MQQFSLNLFCDECGAANDPAATQCSVCQAPLEPAHAVSPTQPPVAPVAVAPPVVKTVVTGSSATPDSQRVPVHFRPGMVLAGRYRIRGEIGRGGFSIVYRAEDLDSAERKAVAIKRIYLRALTPRQIIDATETFNRELAALSRFKYVSGIPRFYEHLTDSENWYLVMEYVNGQTLEDYLHHAPEDSLSERETLDIGIELTQILLELHNAEPPIIFRDIKPANIMITPLREVYLIDFGISRAFTSGKKRDTTPIGTPGYAPPEQYGRAQTDARSDIYSLGATLQTLFTGRDPVDLAAGKASLNPKQPSRALRRLLNDMMQPDAARRPTDLGQVKQRMELIRRGPLAWWRRLVGVILILYMVFACVGSNIVSSVFGIPLFPLMVIGAGAILLVLSALSRRAKQAP